MRKSEGEEEKEEKGTEEEVEKLIGKNKKWVEIDLDSPSDPVLVL
jgi:hypothetical protein